MSALAVMPAAARPGDVTASRVLRSEWTKLRSVRSTRWSLLAAVASLVGLGVLVAFVQVSQWSHDPRMLALDRATFPTVDVAVGGYLLAQVAVGVLGVLVISGEYATGMIRSSLMAVPRRLPLLWAKLGVFCGVTFALMLVSAFVAFLAVQAIVAGSGIDQSLGDPDVLRVIFGAALYLTAVGAMGLGLGALLRNAAGAICALVGLIAVLPAVIAVLPGNTGIAPYLPLNAGSGVATTRFGGVEHLAPWTGFGVFCAYVAAILALAAWRLMRRDA